LIRYPAGISPAIYTGPFDAPTTNNASLASPTPDFVGNLIVTDGASSGEHFNIRVGAVDAFQSVGGIPCAATGPLTVANSLDNTCAQAPGDSGGPVYSYLNGAAQMRGTITGGNSGVACPGEVSTGGFQVIYAPLVRPNGDAQVGSLSVHGVSVMGVPVFDLNGTYADGPGRGPGPVISVQLSNITVDMFRFHRPTAHGFVVDENNISVTFPDDRTYTGQLLTSGVILWSNGTEWIKL
jgi:hypothetical protein